jgi:hypothetical protein
MPNPDDALWASFVDPPPAARPRVWWHWMNGNVDEEGIRLDLEWMARIGIGGAQAFEGGMNTPQVVTERLVFGSPAWDRALRTAAHTADRLGLEFTVATSAGWSAAGAPWVAPEDAMKKVVWSETLVDGGREVAVELPALPATAGRYQDVPRWGPPPGDPVFCRDTVVLAIPAGTALPRPIEAWADGTAVDPTVLSDGVFADGVVLPRELRNHSTTTVTTRYASPVTVAAVTVGLPGPRGFGSPPPVHAVLESGPDGVRWTPIADLPATSSPVRSRSFSPVTAPWFRVRLDGASANASVPPMDAGVLPLPLPPPRPETLVTQFALHAGGRVSAAEEKAGFGVALDDRGLAGPPEAGAPLDQVIDVTAHVRDGVLTWRAPAGVWRILRFGFSLTGHQNGPAPVEATGLEVDKLDAGRVEAYLQRWLGQVRDAVGADLIGERGIRSLLSDSIESGPQNWTESLPAEFERRRGYALLPWMPVLAGYVVDDSERTDRVLADYRRTVAELVAEAYYGTVARVAHEWGLTYYAEALEDHRPQLGDDLEMRRHADVPMGAMWVYRDEDGPMPTYVADLRGASSVAHVHGKAFTGAESLSVFGRPFVFAPQHLKPVADLELALGVTRFCLHTSPHQPSEVRPPGIALAPTLGQTFSRHETWADQAGPWVRYLARASHLLNLGDPVADVLVLASDGDPLTAVYGDAEFDGVPAGHSWDFVSADAMHTALRVEADGTVVSDGGTRYRLVLLAGWTERMTLRTLRGLARLVDDGATLVGPPPTGSPSAGDDPTMFAAEVASLWSSPRAHLTLAEASAVLGDPDWIAPGLDVVHRRLPEGDLYFVRNPAAEPVAVPVSLRATAPGAEFWDAVAGTRTTADASLVDGRTALTITLPAHGSGFVVLRRVQPVDRFGAAEVVATATSRTETPDDSAFSGVSIWRATITADPAWRDDAAVTLRLTGVHDIAEVHVDGVSAGVAWTAPFEVDVTALLTGGEHRIEVHVATPWANRLIRDAAHPETAITQLTAPVYAADAPLRPWGLRGPIEVVRRTVTSTTSACPTVR